MQTATTTAPAAPALFACKDCCHLEGDGHAWGCSMGGFLPVDASFVAWALAEFFFKLDRIVTIRHVAFEPFTAEGRTFRFTDRGQCQSFLWFWTDCAAPALHAAL